MVITLILFLIFSSLGIPFFLLQKQPRDFLLIPVYGLAAWVGLGYQFSANLALTGSESMAASLLTILVFASAVSLKKRKEFKSIEIKNELKLGLLYLIPAFIILIPAILFGIDNFFGAVNFDFFYNSQDSMYLAQHSVLEFRSGITGTIVPLDWSAGSQGRFAISLIAAFFYNYWGFNPLHFNSELLSTLVLIFAISAGVFVKSMYRLSGFSLLFSVFCIVLSTGFVQGYTYYLLGQISALPLFMTVLILFARIIDYDNMTVGLFRKNWNFYAVILLLNILYTFYAILSFFALAILGLAFVIKIINERKVFIKTIREFGSIIAGFILIFVLTKIVTIEPAINTLFAWIHLSLKTASSPLSATPMVFSEYLTEAFIPLLFGLFLYPISASFFDPILPFGIARNYLHLGLGLAILISFGWASIKFFKSGPKEGGSAYIVLSLIIIMLGFSFVFFITESGYSIFKISSWFVPLILPVYIASFSLIVKGNTRLSILYPAALVCFFVIITNMVTALNYIFKLLPGTKQGSIANAENINGNREISILASALSTEKKIILDLGSGIKNAWAANEFHSHEVSILTQNFQPLEDRVPGTPCSITPELSQNALLITDRFNQLKRDLTVGFESASPIMKTDHYAVYNTADIETYLAFGRGAYPVESISPNNSEFKTVHTLRWIEEGVNLFIYSKRSKLVEVIIGVLPGYVIGPINREGTVLFENEIRKIRFNKDNSNIKLRNVQLNAGLNCFYLTSKDIVSPIPRYGAIVRSNISLDFRILNFALTSFSVKAIKT